MKEDEEYDYYNFYNKNDSNFYYNIESQSELDNKNDNIKPSTLNKKATLLKKIENDFINETHPLINNYNNKNNDNNANDYSFLEDNKHDLFVDDYLTINEKNNIEHNNNTLKENEIPNVINMNKGRIIKAFNATVSNAINTLFPKSEEIDYYTMKDMQLIKTKKRRRKKSEIENEKTIKNTKIKIIKPRGRNKKSVKNNYVECHSKKADDNIIKKINTYYIKSINNWLNSSFIDEKGNFLSPEKKFLKINTKQIFANLKKNEITQLMKTTFKDIFSNEISNKYKKYKTDYNKKLIEEIYRENKQYFIKFILDLTFIDGLYIFDGEISINNFIKILKQKNIEERNINQFYNKFDKIHSFLKQIYLQEIKNYSEKAIQDYIHRISLLCVNYENWFIRKYNRSSNKNNK